MMTPEEIAASIEAIGYAKTHEILAKLQDAAPESDDREAPILDWAATIAKNKASLRERPVQQEQEPEVREEYGWLFPDE